MSSYDTIRQRYKPDHIKYLLIAESQPPEADVQSSRQFYRAEKARKDDRLFVNTIKAIYIETEKLTEQQIEFNKEAWLRHFQHDGFYMIEALDISLEHEVTKPQRQQLIAKNLPNLLDKVKKLANVDTKIILIKSNVFDVAAEPLREAGYRVLNTELVDYPGQFTQKRYREKLRKHLQK